MPKHAERGRWSLSALYIALLPPSFLAVRPGTLCPCSGRSYRWKTRAAFGKLSCWGLSASSDIALAHFFFCFTSLLPPSTPSIFASFFSFPQRNLSNRIIAVHRAWTQIIWRLWTKTPNHEIHRRSCCIVPKCCTSSSASGKGPSGPVSFSWLPQSGTAMASQTIGSISDSVSVCMQRAKMWSLQPLQNHRQRDHFGHKFPSLCS